MAYFSQLAEAEPEVLARRRAYPRQPLRSLAYVRLDEANGGIIRDLTESGMAVRAVGALRLDQEVGIRFDLLSPRVRVDARGRVVWANSNGEAGVQFVDLTTRARRALRDWLLNQMFSAAVLTGRDSMFAPDERELTFSSMPRSAILVEEAPGAIAEDPSPGIAWGGLTLSVRSFSIFVDSLVLLCAVLLFSISSIVVMGGTPAWPLAIALLFTASTIFVSVYQILFSDFLCGATPGKRLAMLATSPPQQDEQGQRFR